MSQPISTHLEQEIAQQPQVLRRLLAEQTATAQTIAAAIHQFQPSFVYIAARGTSDNAARYAQYLMGVYLRLPVALATPSVHTLYGTSPQLGRALVIGISQSGQAQDVLQVLNDAKTQGALTVTLTNNPESPMAHAAHHHLYLSAEEEVSVAATKTYTAQLTAVAMLTAALLGESDPEFSQVLSYVPDYVAETLTMSAGIARWAERYRYMTQFAALGRGYNYCTAIEISLKVAELCYLTGNGYSEADFLHGPIAQVLPGFPVVVVAPSGKTQPVMREVLTKLHERQAETLVISNDDSLFTGSNQQMRLPANLPEWLSPITAVIPGQVFALNLALAKGHSVDKPRGLTKVTITR